MSMVTFGQGGMASLVPNNDKFHIRNIIPDMAHKPVFLCLSHYRFPPTALELKTPIMCDFDSLVTEEANIPQAVCFLSILWVVNKTLISLKSCYILSGLVLKQVNLLLWHGGDFQLCRQAAKLSFMWLNYWKFMLKYTSHWIFSW